MQTTGTSTPSISSTSRTDSARTGAPGALTPLLTGAATAIAVAGAVLALTGSGSPLRAPLTLFFLLAAPAAAIGAALRGLAPLARTVTALAGAIALNMLVAQVMLAVQRWSWRGGVITVTVISALLLLLAQGLPRSRTTTGRAV
jgi:hypothetical protein